MSENIKKHVRVIEAENAKELQEKYEEWITKNLNIIKDVQVQYNTVPEMILGTSQAPMHFIAIFFNAEYDDDLGAPFDVSKI
jgi:hypothetical protein